MTPVSWKVAPAHQNHIKPESPLCRRGSRKVRRGRYNQAIDAVAAATTHGYIKRMWNQRAGGADSFDETITPFMLVKSLVKARDGRQLVLAPLLRGLNTPWRPHCPQIPVRPPPPSNAVATAPLIINTGDREGASIVGELLGHSTFFVICTYKYVGSPYGVSSNLRLRALSWVGFQLVNPSLPKLLPARFLSPKLGRPLSLATTGSPW